VEAFVVGIRHADPKAVLALGHGIPDAADIDLHALGVRRPQTGANAPLRIDLGILDKVPVHNRVQRGPGSPFVGVYASDYNTRSVGE